MTVGAGTVVPEARSPVMPHTAACSCRLSRRHFALGLAAGGPLVLSGCDDPPALVSEEELEAMGLEAWSQIRADVPVSNNSALQDALATVSRRLLVAAGQAPQDWEVQAFASPEANAFVLPGRKIGVFEGMFDVVANTDQLAAVVGHEIGHLAANHAQERISAQIATNTGLQIVYRLLNLGEVEYANEIAAALGLGAQVGLLLPYSRSHELEADAYGLATMTEAGFAPREALELWRRMEAATGPRGLPFLATHPAPERRIEEMEEILARQQR